MHVHEHVISTPSPCPFNATYKILNTSRKFNPPSMGQGCWTSGGPCKLLDIMVMVSMLKSANDGAQRAKHCLAQDELLASMFEYYANYESLVLVHLQHVNF